jgi:hypothetical protein
MVQREEAVVMIGTVGSIARWDDKIASMGEKAQWSSSSRLMAGQPPEVTAEPPTRWFILS